MAFKPNYKQQRNERARSKEEKKKEKAARKAARTTADNPEGLELPDDAGEADESETDTPEDGTPSAER